MAKTQRNVSRGNINSKKAPDDGSVKKRSAYTKQGFLTKLCNELEKASAGLIYLSESDNPYQFFALQHYSLHEEGEKLTPVTFLACMGISEELMNDLKIPVDRLIEERSLADFFPTLQDLAGSGDSIDDPDVIALSKQYRKLEKLLSKRLRDVKVFRVGAVDIRCYIAGFINEDNVAGLVTTSIET